MGRKTGRACRQRDCRMTSRSIKRTTGFRASVEVVEKWKCDNCGKNFDSRRKAWNHLWSIF